MGDFSLTVDQDIGQRLTTDNGASVSVDPVPTATLRKAPTWTTTVTFPAVAAGAWGVVSVSMIGAPPPFGPGLFPTVPIGFNLNNTDLGAPNSGAVITSCRITPPAPNATIQLTLQGPITAGDRSVTFWLP
jgi:hypothetical protein